MIERIIDWCASTRFLVFTGTVILTVWGMYFLGTELASMAAGLLAAFFTAASFWHVILTRNGTHAIGAPCMLVWSLAFFLGGIRRKVE